MPERTRHEFSPGRDKPRPSGSGLRELRTKTTRLYGGTLKAPHPWELRADERRAVGRAEERGGV
jgi:hypothetical protein